MLRISHSKLNSYISYDILPITKSRKLESYRNRLTSTTDIYSTITEVMCKKSSKPSLHAEAILVNQLFPLTANPVTSIKNRTSIPAMTSSTIPPRCHSPNASRPRVCMQRTDRVILSLPDRKLVAAGKNPTPTGTHRGIRKTDPHQARCMSDPQDNGIRSCRHRAPPLAVTKTCGVMR